MDIGLHFPQPEMPADAGAIRDYLQTAEELGYSHINVPDHVIQTRTPRADFAMAAKYTTEYPNHETMTVLGFAAGVTTTMRLKSAVIVLPQRQAVLVAKQAAQIDVLSGGRMELGVGVGWNDPEYTALDMDFTNRGRRMEEQIEVMRQLWTEQHVTFDGEWHEIEDAGLAPMPMQQPIPIWIGAFSGIAVDRAARIADGWQALIAAPDDDAKASFDDFMSSVQGAGRDPATVGIEAALFAPDDDEDRWAKLIDDWTRCGATQLVFRPQGDFASMLRRIEAFAPLLNNR